MTIALFPGKFQPPHLGHVISIMSLYDKYDSIIIGITDGEPRCMESKEVEEIFKSVFRYLPKVRTFLIKNTIDDETALPYFPKGWDVIISGNPTVERLARKQKWKYMYLPRSNGIGYRSTDLRKIEETKK